MPPIYFPFLICGIFTNLKKEILASDDEVSVVPSILKFSYKLYIGKHVADIVLPTFVDDANLSIYEEMVNVDPLLGHVRSHILKSLIHMENDLLEIIATSPTRKTACEGIIKMLISHSRVSTSQSPIPCNDNVVTLSNQSHEVSKSGYDDMFNSKNEEEADLLLKRSLIVNLILHHSNLVFF